MESCRKHHFKKNYRENIENWFSLYIYKSWSLAGWMKHLVFDFDQKTELKAEIFLRHMVLLDLKSMPKSFLKWRKLKKTDFRWKLIIWENRQSFILKHFAKQFLFKYMEMTNVFIDSILSSMNFWLIDDNIQISCPENILSFVKKLSLFFIFFFFF